MQLAHIPELLSTHTIEACVRPDYAFVAAAEGHPVCCVCGKRAKATGCRHECVSGAVSRLITWDVMKVRRWLQKSKAFINIGKDTEVTKPVKAYDTLGKKVYLESRLCHRLHLLHLMVLSFKG